MEKFWMVLGRGTPIVRHHTAELAKAEAERLARLNPGEAFSVLESLATVVLTDIMWRKHAGGCAASNLRDDNCIPF
jgi:hypothetical protein